MSTLYTCYTFSMDVLKTEAPVRAPEDVQAVLNEHIVRDERYGGSVFATHPDTGVWYTGRRNQGSDTYTFTPVEAGVPIGIAKADPENPDANLYATAIFSDVTQPPAIGDWVSEGEIRPNPKIEASTEQVPDTHLETLLPKLIERTDDATQLEKQLHGFIESMHGIVETSSETHIQTWRQSLDALIIPLAEKSASTETVTLLSLIASAQARIRYVELHLKDTPHPLRVFDEGFATNPTLELTEQSHISELQRAYTQLLSDPAQPEATVRQIGDTLFALQRIAAVRRAATEA